jgi:transcriptional regulator with XRE-family HTH domain
MSISRVTLDPASLARRRREAEITQRELAIAVGYTKTTLSHFENGKRNMPLWAQMALDVALTAAEARRDKATNR